MEWQYDQAVIDLQVTGLIGNGLRYKVLKQSDLSQTIAPTDAGVVEIGTGVYGVPAPGLTLPVWEPLYLLWSVNAGVTWPYLEPIGPVYVGTNQQVIPPAPPTPAIAVGSLITLDKDQLPVDGITIFFEQRTMPGGETAVAYLRSFSEVSANGGLVNVFFPRITTFRARRGTGPWVQFDVPDLDNFNLPDMLGVV